MVDACQVAKESLIPQATAFVCVLLDRMKKASGACCLSYKVAGLASRCWSSIAICPKVKCSDDGPLLALTLRFRSSIAGEIPAESDSNLVDVLKRADADFGGWSQLSMHNNPDKAC